MSGSVKIRRARRGSKGYEPISRDMIQTRAYSLKARGLLALLESLPPDWECHGVDGIVEQFCDRDGHHAVNEAIKELEDGGHFARMKRRGERGRFEWLYTFSQDPAEVAAEVEEWEAAGGKVERRGPRKARPPATMTGKPEHGEEPGTMSRFSMHGQSADGSSTHGEPPNLESDSPVPTGLEGEIYSENPPTPAAAGGLCEHGKPSCRACGTTPRQKAKDETVAEALRAVQCSWCRQDGASRADPPPWLVIDPERPFELLPRRCDHVTDPAQVVAELRERGVA